MSEAVVDDIVAVLPPLLIARLPSRIIVNGVGHQLVRTVF